MEGTEVLGRFYLVITLLLAASLGLLEAVAR
jgi:hypothetical protein